MDEWYYSDEGQQRGPVGLDEMKRLLDTRVIKAGTMVWTASLPEWTPAGRVDALQISPYAAPESAMDATTVDWSGYSPTGKQARPWVRYWARTCDYLLFCFIIGIALAVVTPQMMAMNNTLFGIVMLALYNLVEPIMLSTIGTTPFKALLNVRVRNNDGTKLTYAQGLKRTVKVWIHGQGLGIPLLTLVTNINAHGKLNRNGITSWDESGGFIVSHRDVQFWRWLILIGFFLGFLALIASADSV